MLMGRLTQSSALMYILLVAGPVQSQEIGSREWARQLKAYAPLQQSQCEVESIKYRISHPRMDRFKVRDPRFFQFYPFGPAQPPHAVRDYRDVESGMTFHVESDGRHLTGLGPGGKMLWVRDPFVDRNMCPYRVAHPFIAQIGPPGGGVDMKDNHILTDAEANVIFVQELNSAISRGMNAPRPEKNARFISLRFNSSQMGLVNIRNGEYYFMGQN